MVCQMHKIPNLCDAGANRPVNLPASPNRDCNRKIALYLQGDFSNHGFPNDLIGYPLTKGASPYLVIDINTDMC